MIWLMAISVVCNVGLLGVMINCASSSVFTLYTAIEQDAHRSQYPVSVQEVLEGYSKLEVPVQLSCRLTSSRCEEHLLLGCQIVDRCVSSSKHIRVGEWL